MTESKVFKREIQTLRDNHELLAHDFKILWEALRGHKVLEKQFTSPLARNIQAEWIELGILGSAGCQIREDKSEVRSPSDILRDILAALASSDVSIDLINEGYDVLRRA